MSDPLARMPNHELRVSRQTARALAGLNPLPEEGGEILVAITRGKEKLRLANVRGKFWLSCDTCPREHWRAVFGVNGDGESA
jgi:hypothetical protein